MPAGRYCGRPVRPRQRSTGLGTSLAFDTFRWVSTRRAVAAQRAVHPLRVSCHCARAGAHFPALEGCRHRPVQRSGRGPKTLAFGKKSYTLEINVVESSKACGITTEKIYESRW